MQHRRRQGGVAAGALVADQAGQGRRDVLLHLDVMLEKLLGDAGLLLLGHGALRVQRGLLGRDGLVILGLELLELVAQTSALSADDIGALIVLAHLTSDAAHLGFIAADGFKAPVNLGDQAADALQLGGGSRLITGLEGAELLLAAAKRVADGVLAVSQHGHLLLDLLVLLLPLHIQRTVILHLLAERVAADLVGKAVGLDVLDLILPQHRHMIHHIPPGDQVRIIARICDDRLARQMMIRAHYIVLYPRGFVKHWQEQKCQGLLWHDGRPQG